jgi:hypothetical protein
MPWWCDLLRPCDPYADFGLVLPLGTRATGPTLPLNDWVGACFAGLLGFIRDVDAASPRPMALLTPLGTGRELGGTAGFWLYSRAASASVFLCLKAGSGTDGVSGVLESPYIGTGGLQPEGLCLLAVGGSIALRAFVLDSCSSARGLLCDDSILGSCDGSFRPEGLEKACDAP